MANSDVKSQDYEKICEILLDGDIPLAKYKNRITGLTVVQAYVDSPIVKGDLTFATEAFDDDGLPHTLEHLVFMGSEDYPYKGVLDLLANKCLASGTNAYTDTDHTNYTLSTAGNDGFLNLLPIYLDHVLFPTLTDSAYLTEVHHVNGNGEDAGVVYCEMQARENTGESRCMLEMLRSLYPGYCGYKSETGGLMKNLRESTNNIKVRQYHQEFYHSQNLCIIVTGPVKVEDIFEAIKPIEDKIFARNAHLRKYKRPWQTPVEPLKEKTTRTVEYSSDTDDSGLVFFGWRGPNAISNYTEMLAISLMLDYLNDTPIAPIQRDFVECPENPWCSSVAHSIIENSVSCFYMVFESVGKQFLHQVETKLMKLMQNIASGHEKLDMERMHTIIGRKIVRILSASETSPHAIVSSAVIGDFLYGNNVKDLQMRGQEVAILRSYMEKNSQFWLDLLSRYFCGGDINYVSIVGVPSPQLMEQMSQQEKERIEKQKIVLGEKLQILANDLAEAIKLNEIPAPASLLNCVQVPSIENIKFHPIVRYVDTENLVPKFRVQYDSIKTNFVTIRLIADTTKSLKRNDRLYLPLISELLMESPIQRENGEIVPYEKIVAELYSDTISTNVSVGLNSGSYRPGLMSMLVCVAMQVEIEKYQRSIEWYRELLYKTLFVPDRIKTIATRMVSDIQQYKRKGGKVALCTMTAMTYQSDSNKWATNFIRQQVFLKKLLSDLDRNPRSVVDALTNVRNQMMQPRNLLVHLTLNEEKMRSYKLDIYAPWTEKLITPDVHIDGGDKFEKLNLCQIKACHELVSMVSQPEAAIVGVGSVETHYFEQIIPSLTSPTHPDVAPVYTLLNYLTQLEGPLWRQLRGQGLSYNFDIRLSTSDGLMSFVLAKSTHVVSAYKRASDIVEQHINGSEPFEDGLLQAAKSTLIFELISGEKSAAGKSMQSLIAHLRQLDIDYIKNLLANVAKVTADDLRRVGPIYLAPLFANTNSPDSKGMEGELIKQRRSVVCCHPSKVDEVIAGFEPFGVRFTKINIDESPFVASIDC